MLRQSNTARRSPRKERNSKKRTLHFPLDENGIILRRHRCALALKAAAHLVIESSLTRETAIEDFDSVLVRAAMDATEGTTDQIHIAALLLGVKDDFVKRRWTGLKNR
jgi:hypothetical protein